MRIITNLLLLVSALATAGWSLGVLADQSKMARWQRFFSDDNLNQIEQLYGQSGRQRAEDLRHWLTQQQQLVTSTEARLDAVNRYFNQLRFLNDADHWQQADYWATPLEMVASGGGDCEDFSIAKYFALRVLNVPANQLRLMYVKAIELDQAHMVLLYLESEDAMPMVLDNLIDEVKSGEQRNDLQPVYSFNAEGLWRARAFDQGVQLAAGDNGIDLWGDLIRRIDQEEARR